MDEKPKFNHQEWVPTIMTLGTWLFAMYMAYRGIHYVPDEWMLTIILSGYGATVYSILRDKAVGAVLKRLPKKD